MLRHPTVTLLRNVCERNSFSAARFWLQGRSGMLPGQTARPGIHPGTEQACLGASKEFL